MLTPLLSLFMPPSSLYTESQTQFPTRAREIKQVAFRLSENLEEPEWREGEQRQIHPWGLVKQANPLNLETPGASEGRWMEPEE